VFFISVRLLLTAAVLLATTVSQPVFAARQLEILSVDISAEILPSGDMQVVETRTIEFQGQFRGADRKFYFSGLPIYSDIAVREDDLYYRPVDQFPTSEPGTYSIKVYGNNYFIVDWSFNAFNEKRTFILEYTVVDAVLVHNDAAELYYQFIGDEWDYPSAETLVTLNLPPGAAADDIRAWGHGPLHGKVTIVSPREVKWQAAPLPALTFLEGRVIFPPELVPDAVRRTNRDALPAILREESRLALSANLNRLVRHYELYYSLILMGAAGFIFYRKWKTSMNRGKVYSGDYFRKLPADYPPVAAGYLWHKKKIGSDLLTAQILDLARRRHIRIEEYESGKQIGSEKGYLLIDLENKEPLPLLDGVVKDFIFDEVYNYKPAGGVSDLPAGKKAVTFLQIRNYAEENPKSFQLFYSTWIEAVQRLGDSEKFFKDPPQSMIGCLPQLLLLFAAAAVISIINLYVLGLTVIIVLLAFIFGSPHIYFSDYGADQLAKWRAFRKFLLHFSNLNRSTVPSLVVWEHYLVYAVVLGVAEKVIEQLAIVFPRLEEDREFARTAWSSFGTAYDTALLTGLGSMNQSLSSTIRSAANKAGEATPSLAHSSTGSSNGFSSGSGFGGGFSAGGGGGSGGGGGGFR